MLNAHMFWMLCSLITPTVLVGQRGGAQPDWMIGNRGLDVARPRAEPFLLVFHAVENSGGNYMARDFVPRLFCVKKFACLIMPNFLEYY